MTPQLIPIGEPFRTLGAVERQNAALMRSLRSEYKLKSEEALPFLGRVKATGQRLASEEDRAAAQRILNYWASIAVSYFPDSASEFSHLELDDFRGSGNVPSASGASSDGPAINSDELCLTAAQVTEKLNRAEKTDLRRLLTLLVTFPPGAQTVVVRPLPADHEFVRRPMVRSLLTLLEENHIIRRDGMPVFWILTDNALLMGWPMLRNICEERKALRDLASGWESLNRAPSALLNHGDQLTRSSQFDDLNILEREFVENSQAHRNRSFITALSWLSVAVVALSSAMIIIWHKNAKLYQAHVELKKQKDELVQLDISRRIALTNANIALEEARKILDVRIEERQGAEPFLQIAHTNELILNSPAPFVMDNRREQTDSLKESMQRLERVHTILSNQSAIYSRKRRLNKAQLVE